jgi:hypothetical protein
MAAMHPVRSLLSTASRRRAFAFAGLVAAAGLTPGFAGAAFAGVDSSEADGRVAERYKADYMVPHTGSGANVLRMNASGTVVGSSQSVHVHGEPLRRTLSQGVEQLPGLAPDVRHGAALDINDAGDAAGWLRVGEVAPFAYRAVRWPAAGGVVDLAAQLPAGYSVASDINAGGEVVGYFAETLSGPVQAVIWAPDGTPRVLPKPPTVRGMKARHINGLSHVAGEVSSGGFQLPDIDEAEGFFWSEQTGVLRFGPSRQVHDLNDRNQVVGSGPIGYGHAYFWEPSMGRRVQNLPILKGFRFCDAHAISEDGVIVGVCVGGGRGLGWRLPVAWERVAGQWQVIDLTTRMKDGARLPGQHIATDIDQDGRLLIDEFSGRLGPAIATPVASP